MKSKIHLLKSLPWPICIAIAALGLFFWLMVFGNQGLYELERLRQVKEELLAEQKELIREKEALQAELKKLKDPDYIKHLIHKELGYVAPDEVMIKLHPSKEK